MRNTLWRYAYYILTITDGLRVVDWVHHSTFKAVENLRLALRTQEFQPRAFSLHYRDRKLSLLQRITTSHFSVLINRPERFGLRTLNLRNIPKKLKIAFFQYLNINFIPLCNKPRSTQKNKYGSLFFPKKYRNIRIFL